MAEPKMIFGLSSSRVDGNIVDEVMDALDDVLEDGWDFISWRRSSATRFIVRATLSSRAIQSDSGLSIRVLPIGQLIDDMSNPRNEWLVPSKNKNGSVYDLAKKTFDDWNANFWPDDILEEPKVEEAPAKPAMSVVRQSPEDEVLKMFGLTGNEKTESEGIPLGLFSYNKTETDADQS